MSIELHCYIWSIVIVVISFRANFILSEYWRKFRGSSSLQELIDVEGDGMADMVFRCIQEMDIDNRMMVLILLPKHNFCNMLLNFN